MTKFSLTILFLVSVSTYSFGQNKIELIDFQPSECQIEPNLHLIQKRIVSQQIVKETLSIKISTWLNCALGEVGQANMNGDTLHLTSTEKPFVPTRFAISQKGDTLWEDPELADCDCYFQFEFVIAGISQLPKFVTLNKELIQLNDNRYLPPTYQDYFGDSLIVSDSYGFYYGYKFYDSQKLKQIRKTKGGYWLMATYFESGGIKKESEFFGDIDHIIETTYDENGTVLEHINTVDKK